MARRRRHRARVMIPTASMADIAMLLIIFFMLASHFAKEAGKTLEPARSEDIGEMRKAPLVVTIDADGQVYFQGAAVGSPDEVESLLAELIAEDTPPELRRVQFKCDANLDQEVFQPVVEAVVKAGGILESIGEKGPRRQ